MSADARAGIEAIDSLWKAFFLTRSLFPRMDESLAESGAQWWEPPGFYDESPYLLIVSKWPVTDADVAENNRVAHWLNENFLIRLYAILEVFDVVKIDRPEAPGYDQYKVVRALRNKLAHGSSGRYDKSKSEDREALERLKRICPEFTPPERYGGRFDLSISAVLWPLVVGVREYAAHVLELTECLWCLEPTPPGMEWTS